MSTAELLYSEPAQTRIDVDLVGRVILNFNKVRLNECRWTLHKKTLEKSGRQVKVHQIPLTCIIRPGNGDGTLHFAVEWDNKPCGDAIMEFEGD